MTGRTEHERAREWRQRNNWSMDALSELTGYSRSAIMWFERGQSPPRKGSFRPQPLNAYAWQRYRRVCHSVATELKTGRSCAW